MEQKCPRPVDLDTKQWCCQRWWREEGRTVLYHPWCNYTSWTRAEVKSCYFFGMDKGLWSGKTCHSWPKKPCDSLEIPSFTWQSTATCAPPHPHADNPQPQSLVNTPQVQKSYVSFGNQIPSILVNGQCESCKHAHQGSWGIITLSLHPQQQGVQEEKGWLGLCWTEFSSGRELGSAAAAAPCQQPASFTFQSWNPACCQLNPSCRGCRKGCGSLKPLLKHIGPMLCAASSLSSASCFFLCWCWDFSWTLRSPFQAPLGY